MLIGAWYFSKGRYGVSRTRPILCRQVSDLTGRNSVCRLRHC